MEMKLDPDLVRRKRRERAWSQQHLAKVTGLGLRTVQRIEATGNASYESAQAIAACLETDVGEIVARRPRPSPGAEHGNLLLRLLLTPASDVVDAYRFHGRLARLPFLIAAGFLIVLFPFLQKLLIEGWIAADRSLEDIEAVLVAIHWGLYVLLLPLCASRLRDIGWPQSLALLVMLPPVVMLVTSLGVLQYNESVLTPPLWANNLVLLTLAGLLVFLWVLARRRGTA